MDALWVDLFAEVWSNSKTAPGPTGRLVEALEVAVCDFGGNEYGRATTGRGLERVRRRIRVPVEVVTLRTGRPCAGGNHNCGIVTE